LHFLHFIRILLASVRIGSIDGQFIENPTRQQMQKSDLNLVVSVNSKGHLGKNLVFIKRKNIFSSFLFSND